MIHGAKAIRWANEDARLAVAGDDASGVARSRFERAHRRRADRPYLPAPSARAIDRSRRIGGHGVPLLVHRVMLGIFDFHRLECARPDMQEQLDAYDAAGRDRIE